jgi:hypothetical protein
MKVIIAGCRHIADIAPVLEAIQRAPFGDEITEVVCGGTIGVDGNGAAWAQSKGIPVRWFRAAWSIHGKSAGPMRNRQMAEYADGLIAVWDGASRGTKNMIHEAERRGLRVFIHRAE